MDSFAKGDSAWKHFVERMDVLAARLRQMEWHLKDVSSPSLVLEVGQWARLLAERLENQSREAKSLVPWMFSEKYQALLAISAAESKDVTPITRSMRNGCSLNEIFRFPKLLEGANVRARMSIAQLRAAHEKLRRSPRI